MAQLKKYNLSGKEVGTVDLDDALLLKEVNSQMIKDYLVAFRNNQRQWSASTKTRAEVKCTGIKPHPQKGTGHARQGSFAAPHYRGGGVAFGPKPKFDQSVKMNKKEKRQVVKSLISEKIESGDLVVLELDAMNEPKTKVVAQFLKSTKFNENRVVFLAPSDHEDAAKKLSNQMFTKSLRNIPKKAFKRIDQLNGFDLALNQKIVLFAEAVVQLTAILGKEGE